MNKKSVVKKVIISSILLTIVGSLSSCAVLGNILGNIINDTFDDIINSIVDPSELSTYEKIDAPIENLNIIREGNKAGYSISIQDKIYQEGLESLNPIGNQKVLVIPVYFKDYAPSSLFINADEALKNINLAFFGEDSSSSDINKKTGWESVKSYYYKSSYGKLDLDGIVTSWCPLSKTLEEVANISNYADPTIWVLREAVNWVKNNYYGLANEYDQDKDGYIDAVALVYPNEYFDEQSEKNYLRKYDKSTCEKIEDLLWAYTYWDYNQEPNVNSPLANNYTWLSYDFLFDGNYYERYTQNGIISRKNLVDAHTYIHEFGHILGLEDYYSYDKLNDTQPIGGLDMMDHNIGDHNVYTKYVLNWTQPILVEDEGIYQICSSVYGGDNALLIPANINDFSYSPFSEYLLIEFYSNTVLNKQDSKTKYVSGEYMFTQPGIKVYHVDSRLVVANNSYKNYYYTRINNNVRDSETQFDIQLIGASNTASRSIDPKFKLIKLLSSQSLTKTFNEFSYASSSDLFRTGDKISNYTFNSGDTLGYNITFNSVPTSVNSSEQKATITITKK